MPGYFLLLQNRNQLCLPRIVFFISEGLKIASLKLNFFFSYFCLDWFACASCFSISNICSTIFTPARILQRSLSLYPKVCSSGGSHECPIANVNFSSRGLLSSRVKYCRGIDFLSPALLSTIDGLCYAQTWHNIYARAESATLLGDAGRVAMPARTAALQLFSIHSLSLLPFSRRRESRDKILEGRDVICVTRTEHSFWRFTCN